MSGSGKHDLRQIAVWFGLATLHWVISAPIASAVDEAPQKKIPIGQFVTVTSPVDDALFSRISSTALKLQHQAGQEERPAVLVLQIDPGTSQFHHVQGLAKFLTSAQISNITTVAWVPTTVTGPNVLVALACKQIVLHPVCKKTDLAFPGDHAFIHLSGPRGRL